MCNTNSAFYLLSKDMCSDIHIFVQISKSQVISPPSISVLLLCRTGNWIYSGLCLTCCPQFCKVGMPSRPIPLVITWQPQMSAENNEHDVRRQSKTWVEINTCHTFLSFFSRSWLPRIPTMIMALGRQQLKLHIVYKPSVCSRDWPSSTRSAFNTTKPQS